MNRLIISVNLISIALCGLMYSSVSAQTTINSSIRALHVVDSNTVVFSGYGGLVGYTNDGGISWDTTRWGSRSYRACSVVNEFLIAASIESPGVVIKAPLHSLKDTIVVFEESHKGVFFDSMKFSDSKNGILMGDATPDISGETCLSIYTTDDSGDNWQRIMCSNLPELIEGEAAFAASNGNISCFSNDAWIATGGKVSRILHSSDKGATWNAYPTPLIQGGKMTGAFCVDFKNAQEGLIIGGDWENKSLNSGNLAHTSDGGKSWYLRSEGEGPGYRSCVVFNPVNTNECVAVGSEGIDYSMDSGLKWQHVSDESFYTGRYSPDGKYLWFAGHKSIMRIDVIKLLSVVKND